MLYLRRPSVQFCRLCFAMLFSRPQIFFQLGLDFLAGLQRRDFRTVKKPFPLTTAAQNMHAFLRKSPLLKEHFFELLKTAISSNACGTSTLKSLLPQAFAVSNVHPRPRKRLARCTLDCGFKTSESPALRGFVGGPRALATAALYLVIFSNGDISPQNTFKTGINAP